MQHIDSIYSGNIGRLRREIKQKACPNDMHFLPLYMGCRSLHACIDMYNLYFMYCKFYVVPSKQFNLPEFTPLFAGRQPFSTYQGNAWFWPLIID